MSEQTASGKTVTIPALGRQGLSLGCLYDLTRNQTYVTNLWSKDQLVDEKLETVLCPFTNWKLKISNNQSERCEQLDVSASIALEIGAGQVKVSGSAKYVDSSNSSSQVASVTYTSNKLFHTKKLTMEQLQNVTYANVLADQKNATHVISSITYGKKAHFK